MRIKLIRHLSRYKSFVKAGIMSTITYRASILSWVFFQVISIIILSFLWQAIYNQPNDALYEFNSLGQRVLNGYTLPQMITYLITSMIVVTLVQSSQAYWSVVDDIREGSIAMSLIKPISYRLRILANSFGSFFSFFLIFFIPLYGGTIVTLGLIFGFENLFFSFQWYNIVFFLISVVISLVLLDCIDFAIAQICFHTGAGFGLMLLKNSVIQFLSGSLLPLAFFPGWSQTLLSYLPFAGLLSIPNLIMMGQYSLTQIVISLSLQIGWLVFFALLDKLVFKQSLKRVISIGG